ncbi:MAG: HD domain-containing phosphohydrolase [Candidatus Aminicenantia bacterium]
MKDGDKTKEQLINELVEMRQRIAELKASETKRKRAEEASRKVKRAFETLTQCNQALVRATEESDLLHEICRIIVEVGGYRLAWGGFAEQDKKKTVRPVAQVGYEEGYLETVNITWADTERGRGPTGTAIRTGKPSICKNMLTDPKYAPWRTEATKRGYASSIALPLIAGGRTFGALNIYAVEPDAFDLREVKLLMELADDLAYGIVALGTRSERNRAEEELHQTLSKLRKALGGIVNTMALTVEKRDPYTAGHQRRVANLARAIAKEMGLLKEQIDGIRMAGVIHDLGKMFVPAEILSKPGRITKAEFSIIKTHPQVGYDILKKIEFPWPVAQIVLQHHERMDGSGYPAGLSGEGILLEARILGVTDVVEAISSHRPYRPALGINKALEEISQNRGVLYDPKVVDACLKLFTEKGFKFS